MKTEKIANAIDREVEFLKRVAADIRDTQHIGECEHDAEHVDQSVKRLEKLSTFVKGGGTGED